MKNLLFLSAILFSFSSIAQTSSDDRPVRTCDVMPLFVDCAEEVGKAGTVCTEKAIQAHIGASVVYPDVAKDAGIQGTVYIKFVIEIDGSIGSIQVMRGVGDSDSALAMSSAAIDAVMSLPDFLPGSHEGEPVRVELVQPVRFVLN